MVIHRYNSIRVCGHGRQVRSFVGCHEVVSGVVQGGSWGRGLPYAVCLSIECVESADVLPPRLIDTNDIGEILDYWPAEVESKVGAIVVTTSRPRLVSGVFTRFLGVFGQNDVYGVEVEEGARCWGADGTGYVVLLLGLGVVGSSGAECDGQTKCQQMVQYG